MFGKLGELSFRLAEADRAPVLIRSLGAATAALPLRLLQIELGISDASADGEMFALIVKALDFVTELRLGDCLPIEVLCGDASWQPDPVHLELARARLNLQLVMLLDSDAGGWSAADAVQVLAATTAAGMKCRLHNATTKLAKLLDLPDADAAAALIEEVAYELSFVEALRDRLLNKVQNLFDRVTDLSLLRPNHPSGLELISRVRRLSAIALNILRSRFDDIEGHTGDTLALFKEIATRRVVIQVQRDWLYNSLRAWENTLGEWKSVDARWGESTWPLLGRTYRFLAPRFMPMQDWLLVRGAPRPDAGQKRIVW